MTSRSREDYMANSEELSEHSSIGSPFSPPLELMWSPGLTPDTASDCSGIEFPDMTTPDWRQTTEDRWPAMAWNQAKHEEFFGKPQPDHPLTWRAPALLSGLEPMTAASWLNAPQGTVENGLSPVLSYTSQTTHTLPSLSEQDMPTLPSRLDLSFATDTAWSASSACHDQFFPPDYYPDIFPAAVNSQTMPISYVEYNPGPVARQPMPVHESHPAHVSGVPHALPYKQAAYSGVTQPRILLPRTEAQAVPSQPVYGPQRILRPQLPVSRATCSSSAAVSNVSLHALVQGGVPVSRRPALVCTSSVQVLPTGLQGEDHSRGLPLTDAASQAKVNHALGSAVDRTEDWDALIRYDHDEATASSHPSSAPGPVATGLTTAVPATASSARPLAAKPQRGQSYDAATSPRSISQTAGSAETDEGRHRNHPLYAQGPNADGLYHCPFASDPACQHRPTKLKCNYDKFVDSHLKPFRCKIESCAKQEFSSTACLLRHEREAHGMHGHGDRPHLCYYAGCERGVPGHGFPRRYNLFDHMKRVHDHKEDESSATLSPGTSATRAPVRRPSSRKRKASEPMPTEPAPHRRRPELPTGRLSSGGAPPYAHVPVAVQPGQYISYQAVYARPAPVVTLGSSQPQVSDQTQQPLYAEWTGEDELNAGQVTFTPYPENAPGTHHDFEQYHTLSPGYHRG